MAQKSQDRSSSPTNSQLSAEGGQSGGSSLIGGVGGSGKKSLAGLSRKISPKPGGLQSQGPSPKTSLASKGPAASLASKKRGSFAGRLSKMKDSTFGGPSVNIGVILPAFLLF